MAFITEHGSGEPPKKRARIGLFDSGLGGLSVLDRMARSLPDDSPTEFIYVGDNARCPYGDRPSREIAQFVEQIVNFLLRNEVTSIVMACNTSAALALDTVRQASGVPVVDLITPAAAFAAKHYAKVGVMATTSTIKSRAFSRGIAAINKKVDVIELACPDLVPIIENGKVGSKESAEALARYAAILREQSVEAVILGCTHFPFLRGQLKELIGNDISIIDPADVLMSVLNVDKNGSEPAAHTDLASIAYAIDKRSIINTTGNTTKFRDIAKICLGYSFSTINGITVEELTATSSAPIVVDRKVSANTVTPNMVPAT